jgi:hypothetical protein
MPSITSPLVIYGDDKVETKQHLEWLSNRFSRLHRSPLPLPADNDYLQFSHQSIAGVKEIWIIEGTSVFLELEVISLGGYEGFKRQFPIHCGLRTLSQEVPLPTYIAPGTKNENLRSHSRQDFTWAADRLGRLRGG